MLEQKKTKAEAERKKAVELRKQSLETFLETRKRSAENDNDSLFATKKTTKSEPIIDYLTAKNESERELWEREISLREKELSVREKEANNMTQMTQMMMAQQQQQSQMVMNLFARFSNPN